VAGLGQSFSLLATLCREFSLLTSIAAKIGCDGDGSKPWGWRQRQLAVMAGVNSEAVVRN